jgi:hypothetical protein
MKVLKRLVAPLNNRHGAVGSIQTMFFIFVSSIFCYIGIDVYGYVSLQQKLTLANNELLEVIKAENGYDASNRASFDDLLRRNGVDPSKVMLTATPKLVQRGETVEIESSIVYECIGLKPMGQTVRVPIHVKVNGLAHTFFR